ncbi:unnamed protein product [Discosporangium mesarthrocarpum]
MVQVAAPTEAESIKVVQRVAWELGMKPLAHLEAISVSHLTGGRHEDIIEVLRKLKEVDGGSELKEVDGGSELKGGSGSEAVEHACNEAIVVRAQELVRAWGLDDPKPTAGVGGEGTAGRWVGLWDILDMLGQPVITVGAGPSSAATPPSGALTPTEVIRLCHTSKDALIEMGREGWLQVTPAIAPGQGHVLQENSTHQHQHQLILPDNGPPGNGLMGTRGGQPGTGAGAGAEGRAGSPLPPLAVTVLKSEFPLVPVPSSPSMATPVYVGAPPLLLAAFRLLVDGPPLSFGRGERGIPEVGAHREGLSSTSFPRKSSPEAGFGDENTPGYNHHTIGDLSPGSLDGRAGGGGGNETGVMATMGSVTSDLFHRARCLIKAAMLRRSAEREQARLVLDGQELERDWDHLGRC